MLIKSDPAIVQKDNEIVTLCTFYLSGRLFGVDILDVKEVGSELRLSPIHHASPSIAGYMNIRGQIHLVVDLRRIFRFEPYSHSEKSRVVIFKSIVDEPFGVIVDQVSDIVRIDRSQIEERRHSGDDIPQEIKDRRIVAEGLTRGICKLEKQLVVLLNARGIVPEVKSCREMTQSALVERKGRIDERN